MSSIPVGILGATGMVGQQFIALLADHPWFKVDGWAPASARRARRSRTRRRGVYRTASPMRLRTRWWRPRTLAARRSLFSGLDSSVAGEIEAAFARAGHIVVSNSRNYRMVDRAAADSRSERRSPETLESAARGAGLEGQHCHQPELFDGGIAMTLAPLRQFGLRTTMVTTLQGVRGRLSGRAVVGYPRISFRISVAAKRIDSRRRR